MAGCMPELDVGSHSSCKGRVNVVKFDACESVNVSRAEECVAVLAFNRATVSLPVLAFSALRAGIGKGTVRGCAREANAARIVSYSAYNRPFAPVILRSVPPACLKFSCIAPSTIRLSRFHLDQVLHAFLADEAADLVGVLANFTGCAVSSQIVVFLTNRAVKTFRRTLAGRFPNVAGDASVPTLV